MGGGVIVTMSKESSGQILGYVVFYVVRGDSFSVNPLEEKHGIVIGKFGARSSPRDAFRKATVFRVHAKYFRNDKKIFLMVRNAPSKPNTVTRHVIREERDNKRELLTHAKVAEFIHVQFKDKKPTIHLKIMGDVLPKDEYDELNKLAVKVEKEYEDYLVNVDSLKVRADIRDTFYGLDSLSINRSTFFVPAGHEDTLVRLRNLINDLSENSYMYMFRLENTVEHRQMLIDALNRNAAFELDGIKTSVDSGRDMTTFTARKLKDRLNRLSHEKRLYMNLLGLTVDATKEYQSEVEELCEQHEQAAHNSLKRNRKKRIV